MEFDEVERKVRGDSEPTRQSSTAATGAFERLLRLAEEGENDHARHAARFLATVLAGQSLPPDTVSLHPVDVPTRDDMLICLEALKGGRVDFGKIIPDGRARILLVCATRGIRLPHLS